jgi:TonB family protein
VRNEPGSEPDPEALKAYAAEQVKRRVQGWALETLASARATGGAIPPHLYGLGTALEKGLADQDPALIKAVAAAAAKRLPGAAGQSYWDQAKRYAQTGEVLKDLPPDVAEVRDRSSANAQALARDPLGLTPAGAIAQNLAAFALVDQMADEVRDRLDLCAQVEVQEAPDGSVASALVIQPSGNADFDRAVLAAARAARTQWEDAGPRDHLRSVWEVRGKVSAGLGSRSPPMTFKARLLRVY